MLRVGLTGELGSGKSTVAHLLAEHGAVVFSSDEMGRALMQPGQAVYDAIVGHFGPGVMLPDGQLNRRELARIAFDPDHPRVDELNALIHPAVLAEQERQIATLAQAQPNAIVVVESALLFTTKHAGDQPWRKRFDCIVLVTAPEELKVARAVQRASHGRQPSAEEHLALEADTRKRLTAQRIPAALNQECLVIDNRGDRHVLASRTEEVWLELLSMARPRSSAMRNGAP